jgi:DNA-binding protein YbaB
VTFPGGPPDADSFVDEQTQRFDELRARAEQARNQLAQNLVTERDSDGVVTIVVGAAGIMQSITFGPRANQLQPAQLSSVVMGTYRQACRRAAERSQQIVGELVGPDSPTVQLLRDAVPPDPEDEPATPGGAP